MKAHGIEFVCDICSHEGVVILKGKPDHFDCPKCGHPCDMRYAYGNDDYDDGEDDNRVFSPN